MPRYREGRRRPARRHPRGHHARADGRAHARAHGAGRRRGRRDPRVSRARADAVLPQADPRRRRPVLRGRDAVEGDGSRSSTRRGRRASPSTSAMRRRTAPRRYNTAIFVDEDGTIFEKYRKTHLPGTTKPDGHAMVYEPYFFAYGDTGFKVYDAKKAKVGVHICQDRRYPEAYRALGLQGAEIIINGYNTPALPARARPQRARAARGRVREQPVRHRRRQGGQGGRRRVHRGQLHHRSAGAGAREGARPTATSWSRRASTSTR